MRCPRPEWRTFVVLALLMSACSGTNAPGRSSVQIKPGPRPSPAVCADCGETEQELLTDVADCVETCGGSEICNCDAVKLVQFF